MERGDRVVIKVADLTYSYRGGVKALKNVSFAIERGEVVSVVGPNDSGKTTLLKCLLKLLKPYGAVYIDGREIEGLRTREIAKIAGTYLRSTTLYLLTE